MRSTNVLTAALVAMTLACLRRRGVIRRAEQGQGGTVVAALGDSITAGAPLWDPDKATRDSLGAGVADEQSQYEYWAERRLGDARFRNCGVSGQRTDEIAKRFDECVAGAEVLIVQGGANDINQGRSVESAAKDLRSMVQRGKQRDLRVAITRAGALARRSPGRDAEDRRLNELIDADRRGGGRPRLRVERGAGGSGQARAHAPEYVSDDQIHPTVAGYKRLAEEVELP